MKLHSFFAAILLIGLSEALAEPASNRTSGASISTAEISNWQGPYIGINGGRYSGSSSVSMISADPAIATGLGFGVPPATYAAGGVMFGGQGGFNWKLSKDVIIGLEADFQAAQNKSETNITFGLYGPPATIAAEQRVDWIGTIRGRLGWLPTERLLTFGTAGLAYAQIKETVILTSPTGRNSTAGAFGFACNPNLACFSGSSSQVVSGFVIGGGFEYELLKNITLKAEYLYLNLGSQKPVTSTAFDNNGAAISSSFVTKFGNLDFNVFRVGANLRF